MDPFREESTNHLKVHPPSHRSPKPCESLERGKSSHKTNTWGLTTPEMEMTYKLGVETVIYARGGSQSTPSDLEPNGENYQIHAACI